MTGGQFAAWVRGFIEGADGRLSREQIDRIADEARSVSAPASWVPWISPTVDPQPWGTSPTLTWASDNTSSSADGVHSIDVRDAGVPVAKMQREAGGEWSSFLRHGSEWVPVPDAVGRSIFS